MLRRAMMAGGGAGPFALKWSSLRKGGSVSLSSGDAVMTKAGSGWQSCLGTTGRNSGKRQFEIVYLTSSPNFALAGAVNDDFVSYADYIGNSSNTSGCGSLGYHFISTGHWYEHLESNVSTDAAHGAGVPTNGVLTIGIDFDADTIAMYVDGTLRLTRTGFTSLGSKLWYPAGSAQNGEQLRLRGSGLAHSISGFTDWDA